MIFDKDLLNYEYLRFSYICFCVLDEFYYGIEYLEYFIVIEVVYLDLG